MLPLLLLLAGVATPPPPVSLRVRTDPFVTLVAGGASVGFDVLPREGHGRLSVAAFVVDVPRFLVPLVVQHENPLKITETAVQLGWFVSAEARHRGFFFGPELYAYQLRTVDEVVPARIAVSHEIYAHATAGFTWFPFHGAGIVKDVYVLPWATIGLPVFSTGAARFDDGVVVEDRLFNWHGTVSVGLQLF